MSFDFLGKCFYKGLSLLCTTNLPFTILFETACSKLIPHDYLPPAAKGSGREIIKCLPYVRLFITFLHKPIISFIYKDIFTKFARNVYGHENLSVQNFGLILKNKMAAIADCLKS